MDRSTTFPMMFAVVYLSAKLGQVTGRGLFAVIRDAYPSALLRVLLVGVLAGTTIEAAADLGGMAAAATLLVEFQFKVSSLASPCCCWASRSLVPTH